MRMTFRKLALGLVLLAGSLGTARAGQEIYLSESPDGKHRVVIHQEVFRRVGDKAFFRYPITLVNLRNRHTLDIHEGSIPFVQETDRGTFQIKWESAHFDWSKDSRYLFGGLEVMSGIWKYFFVDAAKGKSREVTDEIKFEILDHIARRSWACESAKVVLDHWFNPALPVFKVMTDCGKKRNEENNQLFQVVDWVVYDARKGKVTATCMDCDAKKAEKTAWEYFQSTQVTPTPTPVPEETPGVSQ